LKLEATIRRENVGTCSLLFQMVMRYARGKKKGKLWQRGENMRRALILEWGIVD
jgi:hypothetical protein